MTNRNDRRGFLRTATAGLTFASLGDLGFLSALKPVTAREARLAPGVVALRPEIEPLVRLIEETPRERLLEEVAGRVKAGTTYPEVLAALLLAGVRNVQPRPNVGFKFHAVLVVNSAHLASMASADTDRWLPIFWALDYFKDAQRQDERESDWTMSAPDEGALPSAPTAREAFIRAMDGWDEAAADAAVTALARSTGANEIYELMFRYGARDFRSIGHKAIYVANSLRTLQCIGWEHSEPVLRSLAYALLMHEGGNPAQRDDAADRPWRENEERASLLPEGWAGGTLDDGATAALVSSLRDGSVDEGPEQVVELLSRGVSPRSVWDGLFEGAAELTLRQPGIVALHAVTTTNAMHHAYQMSGNDQTRRMLLLQNAAFLPLFREAMAERGELRDLTLSGLEARSSPERGVGAIETIFAEAGRDRTEGVRLALGELQAGADPAALIHAARRLVFLKGNDAHDYKYSSAVLEDYYAASPKHRQRYLAASLMLLPTTSERDNSLVQRTRAALGA